MNKCLSVTFSFLAIFLWHCQPESKRNLNNENQLQDSLITIKDRNLKNELYDAKIHLEDYKILKKMKEIGTNVFHVNFHLSRYHLSYLKIYDKTIDLTKRQKNERIAKIDALKKYLFDKKTILQLKHLERMYLLLQDVEGDITIEANFKNLQLLAIAGSPALKNIYFEEPMDIKYLQIPKNGIEVINSSFQNLIKLKRINLFENQLEDLDLGYIPWIRKVDISDNPIPFDKIDSLRLKYPKINIVSYSYKKKRPGNYINRNLETPVYE